MTATATRPLACTTPTPGSFPLPCPSCQEECSFAVGLYSLEDADAFTCACGAEFSFAFLRRLVNVWAKVLPAVALMAETISADIDAIGEDGLPTESKE